MINSFREVERQFVILKSSKYVKLTGTTTDGNSVLCYAYVDHTAGLTYHTVAATLYVEGDFSVVNTVSHVSLKIRAYAVSNDEVIPVENKALFRQYADIVHLIDEFYYTDPEVEKCRMVKELDQFRHAEYPDDIQVMFVRDRVRPERIWVRTTKLHGIERGTVLMEGNMLNTPYADYGVKSGDTVVFASGVVDEDGTRLCFALLAK